jgi:tRNA(Met) cytidine acetyltransferase
MTVSREEFYKILGEAIDDAIKRFYRILVYIDKRNDSANEVLEVLKLFLTKVQKPTIAYGFHPWATGSKERMLTFKNLVESNGGKLEDIDYSNSERYLGYTFDGAILDFIDDFQPNDIGRFVDLVKGGGIIIIYTNNLFENKLFRNSLLKNYEVRDIYEKRFLKKLTEYDGIFIINDEGYHPKPFKGEVKPRSEASPPKKGAMPKVLHKLCISPDQNRVLEAFKFLDRGMRKMLIITAPRGRGKSAITGLGLAGLIYLVKKKLNVVITAPSLAGASQIMKFLQLGLDELEIDHKVVSGEFGLIREIKGHNFRVTYMPPDISVMEGDGDILIMDEAAAIGINYIDVASRSWKKIALITTVHGYEGSGKAFLKYLRKNMEERKFRILWIEMKQPLRYAEGDPIEKWVYDTLLLDAEPRLPEGDLEKLIFKTEDPEELFNDENKLRQIYGILVTAHYRNNPNDLMIMADAIHHRICGLSTPDGDYIGVTQIAEEGGIQESIIMGALKGITFEGDLIPDRLLKHWRIKDFGRMKGWRIVRIAVLQELQDRGLGSRMLQSIIEEAKEKDIDWIGSSFMADKKVINFWLKNCFVPVHLSPKRNEKLGEHAVIVMLGISEKGKAAVKIASAMLKDRLMKTLHDVYYTIDPWIARLILNGIKVHKEIELNSIYKDKIASFLQGVSPYETAADAIQDLVRKYFWDAKRDWSLDPLEEVVLISKVIQGKPWNLTSITLEMNRTQTTEILYDAIAKLAKRYYNITGDNVIGVELSELMSSQHAEL